MAVPVALEENIPFGWVWKIENFGLDGDFDSQEFSIFGLRWQLRYYCGSTVTRVYLYRNDSSYSSFQPFFTTTFIETTEPKFYQTFAIKEPSDTWNRVWKMKHKLFTKGEKCLSGVVKVFLMFALMGEKVKEHKSIQTSSQMDHLSCLESLSSDFSNLLVSGPQPDVLVKCEDLTIPAHTFVLSARSKVFSAMFRTDMLESRTVSVDIVDLNQPDLKQLLHYIYTGIVPNLTVENAQCLYAAGNKYAVHELQNKCRAFLVENLNEANACSLLVFSDVQSDEVLKNAVTDLLVKNEDLIKSDAWLKFSDEHPRLAIEVYRVYTANN